ncbi:unnamed protein product [Laminaria digitata]
MRGSMVIRLRPCMIMSTPPPRTNPALPRTYVELTVRLVCWPASGGSIVCSRVLPVCQHHPVCCIHLVLPLTRSTKQGLPRKVVCMFLKPAQNVFEPTRLLLFYQINGSV